jgi:hypothetical protein
MHHRLALLAIALLAGTTLAQTPLGILRNLDMSWSARGDTFSAGAFPSTQYTRIDNDYITGWGYDDVNPSFRTFFGIHCFLQDFNGATADPFHFVVYPEGTQVARPDVASPIVTTGSMSMPPGGPGVAAYEVSTLFVTPIAAPDSGDVFVGVHQLTPVNVLAQDGMTVWLTTAEAGPGTWTVRDVPGAGAPVTGAEATYAGFHVPAANQNLPMARSQFHIEPLLIAPGGVASARHIADPLHPAAALSPGTSCLLSSIRPDARSPSANPGRADDLGMTFLKVALPDNSPVLFLGDVSGSFGVQVPLGQVLPGASGALCVNLGTVVVLGVALSSNGEATHLLQFPAALRPNLANIALVQQAVAFDPVVNAFVSGPCQLSAL